MRIRTSLLLLLSAVIAVSTAWATPIADKNDPHAVVRLNVSKQANQIFPVSVYKIDGEEIVPRDGVIRLTPGEHELFARGEVRRDLVPGISRDANPERAHGLSFNFEAGKEYFLGLKANSGNSDDWELIIWKERDLKN